jgi:hypothetical protein
MKSYKYTLDKSSRKYLCPQCGKRKLVRYVDSNTGELQSSEFGRCDREDSCGYLLYPRTEWKEYGKVARSLAIRRESHPQKKKEQVFIPWEALKTTWAGYDGCSFITYLMSKGIPDSVLERVIEMYYLGTINSGHLRGALTIPFINVEDNIAFVQVKMFDESNNTIKTSALHSILKGTKENEWINEFEKNEQKVTCFFGAHLLKVYPRNPIVLVEAPKTAIYGTCYYGAPKTEKDFLWLAVYNKSSLTEEKFKILEGRKIILIPDLSSDSDTFNKWSERAHSFAKMLKNTTVSIFEYLEQYAPDELRKTGGDFADYLAQFSWREFNEQFFSDESDKSDLDKKHFSEEALKSKTTDEIIDFLKPHTGYSSKEIIDMLMDKNFLLECSDFKVIEYLIEINVIKKDNDRDNYYRYNSTPF